MGASHEAVIGCLLGTAVGDALGLPYEGLSPRRQRRLFGDVTGHRLIVGRGMVSDDTDHACMTAAALIASAGDVQDFRRALARNLRWWLASVPAGVGFATLRATLRLMAGVPGERSGVASAGNGPAMRSPILGVCHGADPVRLRELVRASTRLTHTDRRAELGALAVAMAAFLASRRAAPVSPRDYVQAMEPLLRDDPDFRTLLAAVVDSVEAGRTTQAFAAELGCENGVSGYMLHTAPVVLHAWLRRPREYRSVILDVIGCGGDTDTTAAIAGGIVGAAVGRDSIPRDWLDRLWEWPRSVRWIETLGRTLADVTAAGVARTALPLPFVPLLVRNALFATIVLAHGFRRLAPPY